MDSDSIKVTQGTIIGKLANSRLLELLVILYIFAVAIEYVQDPLARSPQLDARENLILASQIASGELADEPMYRAMLYPWLVSNIPGKENWPQAVVAFGILLHMLATFQVRSIARTIWDSDNAGKAAFCLYGINPVSLFYSLQAMDMSLAIVFFLASILLLLSSRKTIWIYLGAGVLAGMACATRPHFLPVAILLFTVPVILESSVKASTLRSAFTVLVGLVAVLGYQGVVNYKLSGELRILPWQGTYNLYAANRTGANGLYYKQVVDVSGQSYSNPARAEAEVLYMAETGARPPLSVDAMNQHWRGRAIGSFLEEPFRWVKLGLFKGYAVLNSNEQYNNLTFSFHKDRILTLKVNPLHYGIIFMLGITGLYWLFVTKRAIAITFCILIAAYGVSLIIYYASARFRLPLVPLLTILGCGLLTQWPLVLKDKFHKLAALTVLLLAALVTYSSFGGIRSKDTYVQDRLLLANACADIGEDVKAARYSRMVLEEYPDRLEAQRIYTISYFNLQLIQPQQAQEFGSWNQQKMLIQQQPPTDPVQDAILGVYFWNWRSEQRAIAIWESIEPGEGWGLAQACLGAVDSSMSLPTELIPLREALSRILVRTNND